MPSRLTKEARKQRRREAARKTLAVLPTLCTLGNLLSGFMSIFFASRDQDMKLPLHWTPLTFAAIFVFVGMIFDALDGRIARMTRSVSDLGEQLDSMADMVTFGVAPAFMAVQLTGIIAPFVSDSQDHWFDRMVLVIGGLYVACTALRLARFNVEIEKPSEKDHSSFKGLPSPAAAGTIASLMLLHQHYLANYMKVVSTNPDVIKMPWSLFATQITMVMIMFLVAIAMVSTYRYTHVVNRYMRGRRPASYVTALFTALLLLFIRPRESLAAIFVIYALSAPLTYIWKNMRGQTPLPAASPLIASTTSPDGKSPAIAPPNKSASDANDPEAAESA